MKQFFHKLSVSSYYIPSFFWYVILVCLLFLSVLFFRLPQQTLTTSVGSYLLSAFPTGLALYSGSGASHYYAISPLNDYVITAEGFRVALLPGENFDAETFVKDNQKGKLQRITETIGNYFGLINPQYLLEKPSKVAYSVSQINSDTVTITKTQVLPRQYDAQTTAITLSYNPTDFVYSPQTGSLFTQHTESEIAWLEEITGITITQSLIPPEYADTRLFTWQLDTNRVVIINQNHSGYIIVEANENQSVLVNPKDNLVEIIESVRPGTSEHTSTMTVQIVAATPQ